MKHRLLTLAALSALAMAAPAQAQVYKCKGPDGRTLMQQTPCADGGGDKLDVRPASGRAPAAAARPSANGAPAPGPAAAAPVAAPPVAAAQPPAEPAGPAKSQLEREADMCLGWYGRLLRNPRDAYYTEAVKEGRVLTMTLHGTNLYGGVVTKPARCEIHGGRLDHDWTKIHADRLGWGR